MKRGGFLAVTTDEKISVIVPVYNTANYLDRCLDSICNQTYWNLEILVVNDGSTDASSELIFQKMNHEARSYIEEISSSYLKIYLDWNNYKFITYISKEDAEHGLFQIYDYIVQRMILGTIAGQKKGCLLIYGNGRAENVSGEKYDAEASFFTEIKVSSTTDEYCMKAGISRIVYIRHIHNRGLFQARLTGYAYATGDYISSIDSDDYIGVDYLRHLLQEAVESNADVIFSSFVKVDEKTGYKGLRTHGIQAVRDYEHYDEEILEQIFNSEGELSVLWFVWGKLYKKSLWDDCYPVLRQVTGHHIMLEDMMYGIVFSSKAHHYRWIDEESYFYVANDSASTGRKGGYSKLFKNITDIQYAFGFITTYLKSIGKYGKYQDKFKLVKDKWSRTWYQIIHENETTAEETAILENIVLKWSSDGCLRMPLDKDTYFYDLCTPWDNRIEELKKKIKKPETKVVSFDVFDTLITRPFFTPSDLFVLLNDRFVRLTQNKYEITFSDIRKKAEMLARTVLPINAPQFEDITLDEIYVQIAEMTGIETEVLEQLKKDEIAYEIRFCQPRKKIKELYDLAVFMGKSVIAISDMYLPSEIVEAILKKCGYCELHGVYVSSKERLTKASGNLFGKVIEKEGISGKEMLHIGDSWENDCKRAQEYGIEAWRTAKTTDLFLNKVSDMNKRASRALFGELLNKNSKGNFIRYVHAKDYFGIRCMMAIAANKMFDNPYMSYEPNTDFNRNPYYIGYVAMGMHEYSFVRWMAEECAPRKMSAIHFVSRDGYLGKAVYDVYLKYHPNLPQSNYFYMSRKSFLPLFIKSEKDWWSIGSNINYLNKTPAEILGYYKVILPYSETLKRQLHELGVLADKPLTNNNEYVRFVMALEKIRLDENIINAYRNDMKKYLSTIIQQGDAMCDVGYSGRAQSAISDLLGYGVDAYYLHVLDDRAIVNSQKYGFEIHSFYDYTPALTGKIRELVQSEATGSCVGYRKTISGDMEPVFEEDTWCYHDRYVIEQIHQGALEFVNDFMAIFAEFEDAITFRRTDASFIYENFILRPRNGDMQIFKLFHFEDDLFFNQNYRKKRLVDIWQGDLEWQNLREKKEMKGKVEQKETMSAASKSHEVNVAPIRLLEPFLADTKIPEGANKWKYYLKSDHIILQRAIYRKYNGKGIYNVWDNIYSGLKFMHHRKKGLNAVGNCKADYTLTVGKPILYCATSAYAVLTCMIHKLVFHPKEQAHLMLSIWRKDKMEDVKKTAIFNKVFLWNDLDYRTYDYKMDKLLINGSEMDYLELEWRFFKEYEKLLPFKISEYSAIVIHGNSMPFGCHLERNEVPYEVIEDGAGLYTNPGLLLHFIEETYPLIEQFLLKKYKIFSGSKWCRKYYINMDVQQGQCDDAKVEDFKPVELLEKIDVANRRRIFNVFHVHEAGGKNDASACLLLTYPLAQREKLTHEEEKYIFTLLADIYAPECSEYHLKAHPDDRTDFSGINGFRIIDKGILSELLWYETKTNYELAISTVSTSLNNIQCAKRGMTFGPEFSKKWFYLLRCYVIAKLIEKNKAGNKVRICGIGVYDEMFGQTFESVLTGEVEYKSANCLEKNRYDFAVVSDNDAIAVTEQCDAVFFLEKPKKDIVRTIRIHKKKLGRNYGFVNEEPEYIYFIAQRNIDVALNFLLQVTDMEIYTSETI